MMEMTAQWRAWAQRVAALSLRERVLILLTGTILLGAAGIYGWLDAADTRLSQERQALTAAQRDLEILTLENQGKQARLGRDPNAQVRQQLAGFLDPEKVAGITTQHPRQHIPRLVIRPQRVPPARR